MRLFRHFRVGNRFELTNILTSIVVRDEYDIGEQRFDAGDVIIDVGAHVGVFSYLCYIQGSRAIHCYEPAQRNFQWLERNLGFLPGVHLSGTAVWRSDEDGSSNLVLSGPDGENTGAHSVLAAGHVVKYREQKVLASPGNAHDVATVPLDAILARFDRVKLLKLDCEGSEFPILLTSCLLHKVERIVGEIHECGVELMDHLDPRSQVPGHTMYRVEDLVVRLTSVGFRVRTRRGEPHMCGFNASRT